MKIQKYLSLLIIFVFIGAHVLAPFSVLADEAITPTDTPTPTAEQQVTPTPTESEQSTTPTPTPTPSIDGNNTDQTNTGGTTTDTSGGSNTGENTSTESANLTPTIDATTDSNTSSNNANTSSGGSSSSITTGDSTTVVEGSNDVNTNSVNSQIINQTINIFVNQEGDIDLSTPFNLAYSIIAGDKNTSPVVNVALTSGSNYAYLSNDIISTANTGANTINGGQDALIKTGNAYSVVSFLNKANFTVVDSVIHVVTINIFGNFDGNIILPEFNQVSNCSSCGVSVDMHNTAVVGNNVSSNADTGENINTTTGSASITTGNSHSIINILDMINTNAVGVSFQQLFISIFGSWAGNFLGWDGFGPLQGGDSMGFSSIGNNNSGDGIGCGCDTDLTATNTAIVNNTILSDATTGKNKIYGGGGTIQTGNAFSAISLINFINSNFFKTTGFFGFINVFGNWKGNIGGASTFIASNTADIQADAASSKSDDNSQNDKKESGGQLSVTNKNNVGAYVHPGDTVTFFMDVTNPGSGKMYNVKLRLALLYNGTDVGGPLFNLGDIPAGKTVHVTTGLVLSDKAPSGPYIAQAVAGGTTGGDNTNILANASSNFLVIGPNGGVLGTATIKPQGPNTPPTLAVKGAYTTKQSGNDNLFIFLSLLFITAFLTIRGIKRWRFIKAVFVKSAPFYTRLALLKSFLL